MFEKIIKWSSYLLVFLLPVFWLPFSFEAFEFNKQYLLFFLASVAFLFWLAEMVLVDKEIRLKHTPLSLLLILFIFIIGLSFLFSVDRVSGFFGSYGRFSNGLVNLISLLMVYILLTNNLKIDEKTKESLVVQKNKPLLADNIFSVLTWSIFFVVLISYFSISGLWRLLFKGRHLPGIVFQQTFNPVCGSLEGLAIFLSVGTVFLISRFLIRPKESKKSEFFYCFLLVAILGLLAIIDFTPAWLVLVGSLGLIIILALKERIFKEKIGRLLLPVLFVIIGIAFLVLNSSAFVKLIGIKELSREMILPQSTSWHIALKGATENIKSYFLGSGIGTFYYDFSKFKPASLNQTAFGQFRFDRAGSHIAELLATIGFLGLFSYLLLVGMFLLTLWFLLHSLKENKGYVFLLFATLLALVISQFVYYQNSALSFVFWLFLGISTVSLQKSVKEKVISFKDFPEMNLILSSVFAVLVVVFFISCLFAARFYLADVDYYKGLASSSLEGKESRLEKAVEFNSYFTRYRLSLARSYLDDALKEALEPGGKGDKVKIQNLIAKSINEAKTAVKISPKDVVVYETLGSIYRDIQPLASSANQWAIKYFKEAIGLDPVNPALYTEIGKVYLLSKEFSKARENFQKAVSLKSDYLDALIQDALVYEKENDLKTATEKLKDVAEKYPYSVEAQFQLGRLYFNQNRLDEAISQFKKALLIFPNHSNSLYSLGLAYQKKGEKEKAISAFEKVLELNPGNPDVIRKLNALKK